MSADDRASEEVGPRKTTIAFSVVEVGEGTVWMMISKEKGGVEDPLGRMYEENEIRQGRTGSSFIDPLSHTL